jgi:hypothetical protein
MKSISPTGRIVRPFIDHGCRVVWIVWDDDDDPVVHDQPVEHGYPYLIGQGGHLPIVDSLESPHALRSLLRAGAIAPRTTSPHHTGCSISPVYTLKLRNGIHHRQRREWVETAAWAGWSHRCLQVFGIGDRVFQKAPTCPIPLWPSGVAYLSWDLVPFRFHGEEEIVDAAGAERAARAFAAFIS